MSRMALRQFAEYIVIINALGCAGNTLPLTATSTTMSAASAVAVPAHRLNQVEYNNTVRDLLPTTSQPANAFPADAASVNGLDNMAAALTISPTLFSNYETAARSLAAEIVDPVSVSMSNEPTFAPGHRYITCNPNAMDPNACARSIIVAFAAQAWRRPVAAADANNLMALWNAQSSTWNENLKTVLAAVLLSPRFLFRLEPTTVGATGAVPLDGYEVANRLSYFLWSSMPDQALTSAAEDGSLLTSDGINAQVERMLQDPKASALGANFAGEWLDARYLATATPDPTVFPAYNPNIATDMIAETQAFFNAYLTNNQPVQNMFTDTASYVNDELANYYGLTPPGSPTAVRVVSPKRQGVLGLGAWLTVTSMTNRTSPTKRGAWILTHLLCSTPPPVPAGVSATLPPNVNPNQTIRQQMAAHDTNPTCAACHSLMDPYGFALGNFNGVAQFVTTENGQPVDTVGSLSGGANFTDAADLGHIVGQDTRFPACLESTLFAYATGYMPNATTDSAMLQSLESQWAQQNYTLVSLVQTIATSTAFRTRLVAE